MCTTKLRKRHSWFVGWLLVAAAVPVLTLAASQAMAADKNPQSAGPATPSAPSTEASKYLGAETCKTCHEEIYDSWAKTPHWKSTIDTKGGPSHQGCEGCHGPGADHVAGGDKTKIFIFEKASTKEINSRCMSCHAGGTQHMNAVNSVHTQNNVSCISCHSQQRSQFQMPFHHRVNEGLVGCSDCHNPHGTVGPKQVRTSATQDAVCFGCH